ncbi:hypothetical protein D1007_24263 [Hordeum vulgare]|nr:hypothetical protein D1007_24263 [Hordeum vulgare]
MCTYSHKSQEDMIDCVLLRCGAFTCTSSSRAIFRRSHCSISTWCGSRRVAPPFGQALRHAAMSPRFRLHASTSASPSNPPHSLDPSATARLLDSSQCKADTLVMASCGTRRQADGQPQQLPPAPLPY